MATILNNSQVEKIRDLNKKFKLFADRGWMCEGSEYGDIPCNAIFNNEIDGYFLADYQGNILMISNIEEPEENLKTMAKIQGDIRLICE